MSSGSMPQGCEKGVFCIVSRANYKHVLCLPMGFSSPYYKALILSIHIQTVSHCKAHANPRSAWEEQTPA